ncbi:phospholipid/cholesterol/gamma-HCH transport system substrate-binding protein [Thermomonospora echinospora]|uniref:Phospholipid/cholesterol/gamma-HCH transport system substrate-binding protein n=1 Tax=Thermomonospora echinospora TaxID=1992 RepID=A0A1H5VME0_9ACTN|nr:MlaD family protein [Thermomonospora echinospora]SEF88482.1 phospholipid/cholesterol/gamma-HCH transport system substrate-binding protein [Thermomonospora echinospora]
MALKSLRDVNHRVVALVSVTVIGAACVFAFAVGQLHLLERGYEMSGVFTDTGGLKDGDDVRVAGVKAGRVLKVEPDFGRGQVIITWRVNAGVELGLDTRADVQTTTLLGGRYLKLSGPVPADGPYADDVPESKRRIPLGRTTVPYTVTDAVEGATDLTRRLDEKAIDQLLDSVAKIESPSAAKLREMLENFRRLSAALNESYPQIERLIGASRDITGTLAAKDTQLKEIITQSRTLLRMLVERRRELAATIGEGGRTVRTLSNVVASHQRELNTLLDNLHLLTTRIAPNMDALNTSFALLGPTFTQVSHVKGNGNWVEGLMTGLGPIQPPGPISTPKGGGN